MLSRLRVSVLVTSVLAWNAFSCGPEALAAKVQFNRDVRPILSENCFACHGPDQGHRKADLRLDVRDDAIAAKAIVPGDATASALLDRIDSVDPDLVMPPPDSHRALSVGQKHVLRQWILEGAEYQQHWSYVKPVKPEIPAGQNGIDFLIGQRLADVRDWQTSV